MAGEKYIPKVGDKVAIVGSHRIGVTPVTPALVTKVYKQYILVGARRFSLTDLCEPRAPGRSNWGSLPDRVEPWTKKHDAIVEHARAAARYRTAADDAFCGAEARATIERLPTARLLEAAEFLRALLDEAKAAKP